MKHSERKLVGTSHDGRYTYHLDADRYVYQRSETDGEWIGWICAQSVFETGWAAWITRA